MPKIIKYKVVPSRLKPKYGYSMGWAPNHPSKITILIQTQKNNLNIGRNLALKIGASFDNGKNIRSIIEPAK